MIHSFVPLVIFFCLGIIFAGTFRVNFWPVFSLALLLLAVMVIFSGRRRTFLFLSCLLMFFLGALCLKNSFILPRSHILYYVRYNNPCCRIEGFIDSVPVEKDGGISFILSSRRAQEGNRSRPVCGKVKLNLGFMRDFKYGDGLSVKGCLRRPPFFDGGSYRRYLYRQGIYMCMNIKSSLQVSLLGENKAAWWMRAVLAVRSRIERVFGDYLSPLAASILEAMVLGQRRNLPQLINNSMVKCGTVHILVVSGFNIGIVAYGVNLLLKLLRLRLRARLIICVFCLVVYCGVTGASPPVVRATVMGVVFLCSYLARRQVNIYNSLGLSAFLMLLVSPRQLFDAGFQLSFASVLAIACIYPKLGLFFRLRQIKIAAFRYLSEGLLVSLACWLATLGIVAANFRILSTVTVLANIFIVPLAGLITLCGFLLTLCALLSPALAHPVAATAEFLVMLLLRINLFFTAIPFAYFYF